MAEILQYVHKDGFFHRLTPFSKITFIIVISLMCIISINILFSCGTCNRTSPFLVILVIVLISMAVTWIKTWIEKYLDQMIGKLDTLAAQKAERENAGEALAVMNGKMERIEKKLDNIERILEKVAE